MAHHEHDHDFHIPGNSIWSPLSCIGVGLMMFGLIAFLHPADFGITATIGEFVMLVGLSLTVFGTGKWFAQLILESRERGFGEVPKVLDIANRYGMVFFIVSEVMFFSAFFAAYFYLRNHAFAWPPENIFSLDVALPTINTLLLLSSGAAVTVAHHAILDKNMLKAKHFTMLTFILGFIFLSLQMFEYGHALFDMDSGVYGSAFYMLTGFHGFHVLVGSLMLVSVWKRMQSGDFSEKQHFYFEATAWYWHFVDVVWLGLYVVVYLF
tara:strand:- start:934 stop:1731 length:798 start_codon:yes stop_codon:yes gene_type:complete